MKGNAAVITIFVIFGAGLATSTQAAAAPSVCFDYPIGEPVTDFIKRSSRISLVRVRAVKDIEDTEWAGDNVEFELVALGTAKGKGPKRFSIRGLRRASADQLESRGKPADHASLGQMTYRTIGGQAVLAKRNSDGVCEFVPVMKASGTYLIFLGGPATSKSFEEVRNHQTDQWYASVLQEAGFQVFLERYPERRPLRRNR
jgi:hypothetical protein